MYKGHRIVAMKISRRSLLASAAAASCLRASARSARDYPVQPVPFTAVHMSDTFWAPRIETNRTVTIPFAFKNAKRPGASGISIAQRRSAR